MTDQVTDQVDPFDQFAALFLTEREGGRPIPGASGSAIELMVVGHLPVRGGLWLAPYVDMLARQIGPASLVRLDGDEPIVQSLRGRPAAEEAFNATSLKPLIEQLAPHTRLWVVRPSADTSPAAILRSSVDRVTLLTSADQVAVTAAYQIIKGLVDAAEENDLPMPVMGVAVIGADQQAGASMVDRLNRTCESFLGIKLPLIATLPRMDGQMRSTGRSQLSGEPCPSLSEVLGWIALGREMAASAEEEAPREPEGANMIEAVANEAREAAEVPVASGVPAHQPVTQPAEASSATDYVVQSTTRPVQAAPFKLPPKPIVEVEPKAAAMNDEPNQGGQPVPLAQHVDGLSNLPIRMPAHERIELAHDANGQMHLLCREDDVRELPTVRSWAWAHREILQMACPVLKMTRGEAMPGHVLTAAPLNVSDLHGGELHLHLLAPVRVGDQTTWFSTALYKPTAV